MWVGHGGASYRLWWDSANHGTFLRTGNLRILCLASLADTFLEAALARPRAGAVSFAGLRMDKNCRICFGIGRVCENHLTGCGTMR
jgi:hypothetical protein